MPPRTLNSLFLEPITESELEKMINSLNNVAPGCDGLTTSTLKSNFKSFTGPLTYLIKDEQDEKGHQQLFI